MNKIKFLQSVRLACFMCILCVFNGMSEDSAERNPVTTMYTVHDTASYHNPECVRRCRPKISSTRLPQAHIHLLFVRAYREMLKWCHRFHAMHTFHSLSLSIYTHQIYIHFRFCIIVLVWLLSKRTIIYIEIANSKMENSLPKKTCPKL